ncbi:cold-responsive protein kinase 1 [Cryptomeria japonica]|uniref:cold-responsive protein kinase 1 n=1 Tax=Cryptomeria japonica TaxID=3369 RepID=UPI0025AD5BE8|nr:cold-responsive protein kinase 1 [Cryptomeria japonica]
MEIFQVALLLAVLFLAIAGADPEANLLQDGCSDVKSTNVTLFQQNLNTTLKSLLQAVASSGFATNESVTGTDPVYGLAQCRQDKNSSDCVACITVAEKQIRNCSNVSGGRTIYDGCFLRYESNNFYTQSTADGNEQICGDETISNGSNSFSATAQSLISDLCIVTPKTSDLFAAQSRKDASNTTIYGLAWCLKSVGEQGCKECLTVAQTNIANCFPRLEGRAVDVGCSLRYATYSFFSDNATTDLAQFSSTGSKVSSTVWIIIVVVGTVIIITILISLILFRQRLLTYFRRPPERQVNTETATELRGPVDFDYKALRKATNNFSPENKIGEGGFGQVYKGTLKNGKIVAVKKLTLNQSARAIAEFESEVKLVSNVHHRNLVRLLGCCKQGPERLLVYEYMSNTSLDRILFGESEKILTWQERFNIILGTARGLAYLHEDFHVCIIHRDIKSSNILLDETLQAKIADFGLARLLPGSRSHLTTRTAGTLGYTAPEYAIHGQLTEKADTYSFGVVVLELITGRKSIDLKQPPEMEYLLEWVWKQYESGNILSVVDKRMEKEEVYNEEEILKVLKLALLCIQASVVDRPSMSQVVAMLVSGTDVDYRKPFQPAFVGVGNRIRGEHSSSVSGSSQSNATITESLNAR